MEKKEIVIESDLHNGTIAIEPCSSGGLDIVQGTDMITMSAEQATALHAALDEMLNQWRDAKIERPKITGSYFVTDGHKVEVVKCIAGNWVKAYMFITHWKEITKPIL